ncbi:hypothetical protein DIPPA_31440 [Diplonema papillatum]|nr:hypothetical protein DIPPA_31440 [Diplonema papillatum]
MRDVLAAQDTEPEQDTDTPSGMSLARRTPPCKPAAHAATSVPMCGRQGQQLEPVSSTDPEGDSEQELLSPLRSSPPSKTATGQPSELPPPHEIVGTVPSIDGEAVELVAPGEFGGDSEEPWIAGSLPLSTEGRQPSELTHPQDIFDGAVPGIGEEAAEPAFPSEPGGDGEEPRAAGSPPLSTAGRQPSEPTHPQEIFDGAVPGTDEETAELASLREPGGDREVPRAVGGLPLSTTDRQPSETTPPQEISDGAVPGIDENTTEPASPREPRGDGEEPPPEPQTVGASPPTADGQPSELAAPEEFAPRIDGGTVELVSQKITGAASAIAGEGSANPATESSPQGLRQGTESCTGTSFSLQVEQAAGNSGPTGSEQGAELACRATLATATELEIDQSSLRQVSSARYDAPLLQSGASMRTDASCEDSVSATSWIRRDEMVCQNTGAEEGGGNDSEHSP